jgi:predicted amidohydrolase YtcJ
MLIKNVTIPASAALLALAVVFALACPPASAEPADIVLRNGKIYTVDPARSLQSALAIKGNTIAAVGRSTEIEKMIGPNTKIVDLGGKFVMPGLIDAHSHPVPSAATAVKCSLAGVKPTIAAIKPVIQKCLADGSGGPRDWLEVVQLYNYGFQATAADIDTIEAARPIVIVGNDGHTMWANTRALAVAGITSGTKDPPGGKILRDATGTPNGVFADTAVLLVWKFIPARSTEEMAGLTEKAIAGMNAVGLTALTDAYLTDAELAVWENLYRTGRLKMRVRGAVRVEDLDDSDDATVDKLVATAKAGTIDPDWLRADSVKMFADGVIEYPAQTAALLRPYLTEKGQPTGNAGELYFEQDKFNKLVTKLDKAGLTIHIHAIGDRAVRACLDALEAARKVNGPADNRHQIAHLQLVDPADFARFAKLGVIANVQLEWAKRDPSTGAPIEPYLGPDRYRYVYPYGSLRAAGALLAAGSDWDISPYNPFLGMQIGATRRDPASNQPPLNIEERLSVADMIAAYTIDAAVAMRQEKIIGSLEPGKRADLVVLDRDLFAIDPSELGSTTVLATYLDGKLVFER